MACTLIAGKVEECPRRVRDVVNIYHWMHKRIRGRDSFAPMGYISDEYYRWRNRLTDMEMIVLRDLGFDVQPRQPVGLLVNYLNALEIVDPRLAQRAVNYVNDGMRSVACVCFQPHVMASAAVALAAQDFEFPLPEEPSWTDVFDVGRDDLLKCQELMRSVYKLRPDTSIILKEEDQKKDNPEISSTMVEENTVVSTAERSRDHHYDQRPRSRSRHRSRSGNRSRTYSRDRDDHHHRHQHDQHKDSHHRSRSRHRDRYYR